MQTGQRSRASTPVAASLTWTLMLILSSLACLLVVSSVAQAQSLSTMQGSRGGRSDRIGARGFVDVGIQLFAAKDSFETILGSSSGPVFGGGGQVTMPNGLFFEVGFSRFNDTGQRVFIFNGEVFDLGIPTEITVTPIDFTGGYRFLDLQSVIPFVGGGVTLQRYQETSPLLDASEDVDERYTGFHILGGAEFPITRWAAVAGEVRWSRVPDALGQGGVSVVFGEGDLGGIGFRVRFLIGQ